MMRAKLLGMIAVSTLLVAGCGGTTSGGGGSTGSKPAPFDKGPVKIALVRQSGAGDYFQQWNSGAIKQAAKIGFSMTVYDAQADNSLEATQMETAINSGVAGIIVDHGLAGTMNPLIDKALAKNIPVVVYDVEVTNPKVVHTTQSDAVMATKVLEVMQTDLGKNAPVGYVNVLGIAPLDRRHVVWQKFVADNGWRQEFFVGKFTNAVATDNAALADASLKAHPDVKGIFAPYDELSKGTVVAVKNNSLQSKIKVYGIDISNADIEIMTQPDSPWVATAATDPAGVGAAVVRTMALQLAGQQKTNEVSFSASLITQKFLRDNNIKNMVDLRAKLPSLTLIDVNSAPWIPAYN